MSKVANYKGIHLVDLVDCIDELESSSKNSITFCGFDLGGEKPTDKSFIITKTDEGVWYVVEKYFPFSKMIDKSKTFCAYLDSDYKLHIDENANIAG